MSTKVIINADDFGYTNAVNYGILDAHLRGVLTSTTLMANMPGFNHAVAIKEATPTLGVGVHLVLTSGAPVLKTHTRLIDTQGYFHRQSFYADDNINVMMDEQFLSELRAEWTAQIEKIYDAGIKPTHIDGHHHLFIAFPETRALSIELAKKYHLPLRIDGVQLTTDTIPKEIPHVDYFEPRFDEVGFDELRMNRTLKETYYQELLAKLKNYEKVEIMTHPAYISKDIMETSSWNLERMYVLEELIASTFATTLKEDEAFELITYADIMR